MEQLFTIEQAGLLIELLRRNLFEADKVGDKDTINLSLDTLAAVYKGMGRKPMSLQR